MTGAPDDHGLGRDGRIRREGSLDRVPPAFGPLVADLRDRVATQFGARLHSAYLYGSIPRGVATPGRSDLDAVILLRGRPLDGGAAPDEVPGADAMAVRQLAAALDEHHPVIDGAGLLCWPLSRVLDPAERYNLGFFLSCLCTPLCGEDVARWLPRYRPTRRLARDTNGDIAVFLDQARADLGQGRDPRRLCRSVTRRLVRTGFTLVMPRWNGWTSDLPVMAEVFGQYYPAQADAMAGAAALAMAPAADAAVITDLIGGLGQWLAGEYGRTIGVKAPRA